MEPVPDPLLLRKSGSAGNRTRDLCICSQKLWPLDHRGGLAHYWLKISGRFYLFQNNSVVESKITQFPGARSPLLLNSLRWPLIYVFVAPYYGPCFLSTFWRLQFWGFFQISEGFLHLFFNLLYVWRSQKLTVRVAKVFLSFILRLYVWTFTVNMARNVTLETKRSQYLPGYLFHLYRCLPVSVR